MLRRQYPERRKNISQQGPVKAVRLSLEAAASLDKLNTAIEARWGKDQAPSISMMISKALNIYADKITYNPERLAKAYQEFVAESTVREE